jgi:hypothetical protein
MLPAPPLRLSDVRASMPGRGPAPALRAGPILGVAVHHSATAHPATGLSLDTAQSVFHYHVHGRGYDHGGYHYLVRPTGLIEYALDEAVPGYHAGFADPDDALGLERGQYWNHHYLAVCVLGWFEDDRQISSPTGQPVTIPNYFTRPTAAQWQSLLGLLRDLRQRHAIRVENIRGHHELAGCRTRCPGANVDLEALRRALLAPAADGAPMPGQPPG